MPRWQTSWIFFFTHLDHESIKKPYTYELFQVLYTTYETVYLLVVIHLTLSGEIGQNRANEMYTAIAQASINKLKNPIMLFSVRNEIF